MKLGLHNNNFHADDVFCAALIKSIYDEVEIIRTRDEKKLSSCDIVADVGNGKYDHHQKDKKVRSNGVPYSGISLLWEDFAKDYISKNFNIKDNVKIDIVKNNITNGFLLEIDAYDNGIVLNKKDYDEMNISQVIYSFNPDWNEDNDEIYLNICFQKAIEFATHILYKKVKHQLDKFLIEDMSKKYIKNQKNEKYLIFDKSYPWEKSIVTLDVNEQYLYVIFPAKDGTWISQCIPKKIGEFINRKNFPINWGGLRCEKLEEATGVKGSIFCHSNLFMIVHKTKEGAIDLTNLALKH